ALGGVPPASLTPTVTIPGSEPLSSFDIPVGVIKFKTWQIGSGDDCELAFFGLYVNDTPLLAYVYDDNEDDSVGGGYIRMVVRSMVEGLQRPLRD
ncbi:hypothetical protein PoB_001770900, partial [Plakobranchus ocellatus]